MVAGVTIRFGLCKGSPGLPWFSGIYGWRQGGCGGVGWVKGDRERAGIEM